MRSINSMTLGQSESRLGAKPVRARVGSTGGIVPKNRRFRPKAVFVQEELPYNQSRTLYTVSSV
jgi:hypothetical protein